LTPWVWAAIDVVRIEINRANELARCIMDELRHIVWSLMACNDVACFVLDCVSKKIFVDREICGVEIYYKCEGWPGFEIIVLRRRDFGWD
jgi:hypothetical protein